MIKQRAKSKTYWLSILALATSFAAMFSPEAADFIRENTEYILIVLAGSGIVIREKTTGPLSDK